MKDFSWTFGSANYIEVKRINCVSSCANFTYDEHLRIKIAWTVSFFTEGEWEQILACVKQAKNILKKVKRI